MNFPFKKVNGKNVTGFSCSRNNSLYFAQSLLEIPFTETTLNKYQQNSAEKKTHLREDVAGHLEMVNQFPKSTDKAFGNNT